MMFTKDNVLEALHAVQEPSLKRSMSEVNGFRDIMVKENTVRLTAALFQELEKEQEQNFRTAVVSAIQKLDRRAEVHLRIRVMTEYERKEIIEQTSKQSSAQEANAAEAPKNEPMKGHGENLHSELLQPDSGVEFIAVASGKGGVGKSTVTVNLAVALARKGKKVGIIDADIYGFSVPDMLGIEGRPEVVDNRVIPVERHGVKVISMGFFVEDNAPVVWRGPMLGKMLRNFFAEVSWGELDYVLLDLPPGTGDIALDVHQMIPQSKEIIVTTPHATASFVAARAGAMAIHTKHEILGVVENMSYYQCGKCGEKDYVFGKGGGAKLAEELRTELLAQIPLGAPDNHPSERDFSPSVYKAETEAGRIYLQMAERIVDKLLA